MLQAVSKKITGLLLKNQFFPEEDYEIYLYGTELIVSSILGISLILTCGIIFKCFIESLLFLTTFLILRTYTGGFHCTSYLRCNTVFVTSFLLTLMLYKLVLLQIVCQYILLFAVPAISLVIIANKAPVEHVNKPIDDDDKKKLQIKSIVFSSVFIAISIIMWFIGINSALVIDIAILVVAVAMLIKSK